MQTTALQKTVIGEVIKMTNCAGQSAPMPQSDQELLDESKHGCCKI